MQVLIQSASLYVLLNQLNGDNGALFLPKAGCALIVAALQCFSLTSSTTYQGKDVSCLGTAESHLVRNVLLIQLSCYQARFKPISQKYPIKFDIVVKADGLITGS